MTILNFFNQDSSHRKVVHVLDMLLHVTASKAFSEKRNLDINLYNILNTKEVNQKIHEGLLPIIKHNKNLENTEFILFINSLYDYMIYDEKYTDLYMKVDTDSEARKLFDKITSARNYVIEYLYIQKVLDDFTYNTEINRRIKFWVSDK